MTSRLQFSLLIGVSFTNLIQIHLPRCLFIAILNVKSESAWCEKVYEAKAAGLLLYGRALGLSHGEAEDVLQETFLALMQKPAPPEQPGHYCIRCFRNRALNYRRSLWRRLTRELESRRWFERAPAETPQERAAMRCLAMLPAEQREVIVLKIWHQYTYEEIGQLLGLSPNTAAGRYRYGLQKLRACLKGEDYERVESIGEGIALLDPPRTLGEA
jgi:RNA polymerase sigma-70 factor (ECF subfamily)